MLDSSDESDDDNEAADVVAADVIAADVVASADNAADVVAADPTTARAIAAAIATTLWLLTCIFYPSLGIKSLVDEGVLQQHVLANPS